MQTIGQLWGGLPWQIFHIPVKNMQFEFFQYYTFSKESILYKLQRILIPKHKAYQQSSRNFVYDYYACDIHFIKQSKIWNILNELYQKITKGHFINYLHSIQLFLHANFSQARGSETKSIKEEPDE